MKIVAIAAVAAVFVVPAASTASPASETITVSSPPTVQQWSAGVSEKLGRNLRNLAHPPFGYSQVPTGLVAVRFKCSEDGRPSEVKLSQKSNNYALNGIALRTVSDLRTLHPLPTGMGMGQVYEAVISVALDNEQYDRQMRQYRLARAAQPDSGKVYAILINSKPSTRSL